MTVAAELAKGNQRLEYFICIEGVGWPATEADLSDGFDGVVWTTADIDGDLATQLGCTVYHGLMPPSAIEDSVDPVTGVYGVGGLSLEIIDADDWWVENYQPHAAAATTTLNTALQYWRKTLRVSDGTSLSDGDVIYIAGREAILLDNKTLISGTIYQFSQCTRGYLGTDRGRVNGMPNSSDSFQWDAGTDVYTTDRFWHSKAVELYAHVPGESSGNCIRLWSGKLSGKTSTVTGDRVKLTATGDLVRDVSRVWRARDLRVISNTYGQDRDRRVDEGYNTGNTQTEPELGAVREVRFGHHPKDVMASQGENKYALAAAYRYRTEPGGTAGMRSSWDAGNVQALDSSNGNDFVCCMRYVRINKQVFLAKKAADASGQPETMIVEPYSSLGYNDTIQVDPSTHQPIIELFENDSPARFLIDNWSDTWEFNHYAINKKVTRHPIDLLLCHLMSRDDEYVVRDTHGASPGSATTINFASAIADAASEFVGAALFSVEGNNKGEAYPITASGTTSVTVEDGFSNAPAVSEEYQIRNTVYDTLPIGWGLGVPWWRVDIDSFEAVRDKQLADARISRFIMGTQDKINLWEMLRTNILQPYGVMLYVHRTTGKLTAQYIGQAVGDGIIDDYISIADEDIINISDIDDQIEKPLGTVTVKVRARPEKVVGLRTIAHERSGTSYYGRRSHAVYRPIVEESSERIPEAMGGDTQDIECKLKGFESFSENDKDEKTISALFNTAEDSATVVARAQAMLYAYAVAPPRCTITVHPKHIPNVWAGKFLIVSKDDGPINPYLGTRGWSQLVCFVLGTKFRIVDGPSLECTVAMLNDLNGGKIAPASKLDGALTGTDGTSDYFVVEPTEYVADAANDKDYYHFAVGDLVNLYDVNGAAYGGANPGPYTISGFGANNAADPEDASTDIIRIEETAPAAGGITANHYLSFYDWSGSNTARMEKFAAYADNATGLLTGGDAARHYV